MINTEKNTYSLKTSFSLNAYLYKKKDSKVSNSF